MEYKLIALDMDETALTHDKRLTEKTAAAMVRAIDAGKHVVFATGRSICVVKPYMDMVPGMRWAVTSAGACIMDMSDSSHIYESEIDPETVKWIICSAAGADILPIFFIGDTAYCPNWAPERAGEFHVAAYAEMYRRYMTKVDDVFQLYMEDPRPAQKVNLLFSDSGEKADVYEKIKLLPLTFTTSTCVSMEINAAGVSKAAGLKKLCSKLGVPMDECIAVGDAENDMEMIRAAGLGIAMGNAQDAVKAAAGAVVSDCEHDGAAEAIEQYLLQNA
jgi:Cof subfamily protein (haloacid dehalogenase superfamily)